MVNALNQTIETELQSRLRILYVSPCPLRPPRPLRLRPVAVDRTELRAIGYVLKLELLLDKGYRRSPYSQS